MRVVAYDPFVSKERFRELGAERVESSDEVLAAAEFLTLHLPLMPETQGFLGREAIAKLRDGVRVINAARGELVDEAALEDALRSGRLAGAALDALAEEPPERGFGLGALDSVVLTPHIGAHTDTAARAMGEGAIANCLAVLRGAPAPNPVSTAIARNR